MRSCLVALLMLFCLPCSAAAAAEPGWDPRITTGTLQNGLRYFLYDSEKATDPFNIRLIVHAGSVDEPVPSGIAHILEHMVFQTNTARGRSMHEEIEALGWRTGVEINAVTREAETQFMLRTRPGDALDLSRLLAVHGGSGSETGTSGRRLGEGAFRHPRRTAPDRKRRGSGEPLEEGGLAARLPLCDRPTIGTHAGISRSKIEDIRSFYRSFYRASNMTLIVSGRIDRKAAEAVWNRPSAELRPNRLRFGTIVSCPSNRG